MIRAQTEAETAKAEMQMKMEMHQLDKQQKMADIKKTESETIKNLALAEAAELGQQLDQYAQRTQAMGKAAEIEHQMNLKQVEQQHKAEQMQMQQQHEQQMMQQQAQMQPPPGQGAPQ
jgi:hypothetical protein